ncbi:MAG: metal dependent [Geobacteraceae bacterium]|nr:MAG: metal dependent [Geobacteraceae bacterium]
MNSLKIKILGLITVIVVVIVSTAAFINFEQQKRMVTSVTERDIQVLTDTIKTAIASAMRSGHSTEVSDIFARIKSQKFIKGLRIVDETGKILNSADKAEIGKMTRSKGFPALKAGNPPPLLLSENAMVFYGVTAIHNGRQCYGCHDSTHQILGMLEIEMSMDNMNSFINEGKKIAFISTVIIILLIMISISVFLVLYVDRPIRHLISSMQTVEKGDFESRTVINSSREMNLLSRSYNRMIDRLKEMMETTIEHERELARAEEKLVRHHESQLMNRKLAEQLIEIEHLNTALGERIEEIEESNYKIADLAGELEDKNTNLEKAVAKLSTLYKVGLGINSTMELDRIFDLIVKTTMETLHAQIGYIILHDSDRNVLEIKTLLGLENISHRGHMLPMTSSSISAWVISNRKPLLIPDIGKFPGFDRFSVLGYARKTLVSAPITTKDEIIGTITVVNKHDDSVFNNEDMELLSTIATQAGIAINNAKLYDEQQKTYLNTIHALVSAIEASDSYTRGHSERVTRYSLQLGRKLDLPHERMKVIERAAILHDIGKIGIELTLLHKKGLLTSDDIRNLQQHPTIGMKILEPIEFLNDVRLCIGQHHERYDGQGYPNNLSKGQLLLESRILAITDAFDAMTSDRPYRNALTLDAAIKELYDNAGGQFDPDLVPHFVELLESGAFPGQATGSFPTSPSRVPFPAA